MTANISLGFYISQTTRLHKAILSEKLDNIGITYCQIGFIMQAVRNPGRSQDELASVLSIDKGAAARAIARLEKNGFLHRKENPENKRQKLVYPTEMSLDLQSDLLAVLKDSNEVLLADLDEGERDQIFNLLKRIIDTGREELNLPDIWEKL